MMNQNSTVTSTTGPLPSSASKHRHHHPRLTSILGSFLETAIHEIIFFRSLYPHDAFTPNRYQSIAVHACRHPQVVDYIFQMLNVAVPCIISGLVDGLYLVFYEEDGEMIMNGGGGGSNNNNRNGVVKERFCFEFQVVDDIRKIIESGNDTANAYANHSNNGGEETDRISIMIQELEQSLRDVLLSIISLQGTDLGRQKIGQPNKYFTDKTTFKLCMHTKRRKDDTYSDEWKELCPELKDAIDSGKWMRSDPKSCQLSSLSSLFMEVDDENDGCNESNINILDDSINQRKTRGDHGTYVRSRPLKSMNVPSCGLRMQVMMDFGYS